MYAAWRAFHCMYLTFEQIDKIDKIYKTCLVDRDYDVINNSNSIVNHWLSLCSKCPPFTLTHA